MVSSRDTLVNKFITSNEFILNFLQTLSIFNEKLYERLYSTLSKPGLFYGATKVHKLKEGEGADKPTLRSITSNIVTATPETA